MTERPFTSTRDPKLNGARVVEAVVIALVTGVVSAFASSYVVTVRLDERLQKIAERQAEQSQQISEIRRDLYRPRWDTDTQRPRFGRNDL